MQGAHEYATIFSSGQHGRLYLVAGQHARGKTFHIWVLPTAEPVACMPWSVPGAVEVYGITGGQPGWTETYGWLHRGKWEQDFSTLVALRRAEIAAATERLALAKAEAAAAERQRVAAAIAAY